jgi:hypothetical protein
MVRLLVRCERQDSFSLVATLATAAVGVVLLVMGVVMMRVVVVGLVIVRWWEWLHMTDVWLLWIHVHLWVWLVLG